MRYRPPALLLSCLTASLSAVVVTAAAAQTAPAPLADVMDYGTTYEQIAFKAADRDGDGRVSEAEFVRDAAAAFADLDANGDRRLAPSELAPHDPAKFARVDANGDGFLTFSEVMKFKMKAFQEGDDNADNALSYSEMVESVTAETGSKQ